MRAFLLVLILLFLLPPIPAIPILAEPMLIVAIPTERQGSSTATIRKNLLPIIDNKKAHLPSIAVIQLSLITTARTGDIGSMQIEIAKTLVMKF